MQPQSSPRRALTPIVKRLQGKTILLVEDNKSLLPLFGQILSRQGATCLFAENGRKALTILANDQPDLIVTDLSMPEQDGVELLKELNATFNCIPTLAMSANPGSLGMASYLGAGQTILKPFGATEFLEKTCLALDRTSPPKPLPRPASEN